jgi:hypothetical protein
MGYLGLVFAVCVGAYAVKWAQWVWSNRSASKPRGSYGGGTGLGNALQSLQGFVQPRTEHVIEARLDETQDEDDVGEPKDPTAHLLRQARRIRNGEEVDRLTTLLPR